MKEKINSTGDFKMDCFEDLLDTRNIDMLRTWRAFYNEDAYIALPLGNDPN